MYWSGKHLTLSSGVETTVSRTSLVSQGFITAIANPKGWAFMLSILPPFIDASKAITFQLLALVSIIMLSEFICMMIYATGGRSLKSLLNKGNNIRWMNAISGTLLFAVGVWLALS